MRCPKCNHTIPDTSAFCAYCGAWIKPPTTADASYKVDLSRLGGEVSQDLLDILICPDDKRDLECVDGKWLVCHTCGRRYPIVDGMPIMLIEVGERYKDESLITPPSAPQAPSEPPPTPAAPISVPPKVFPWARMLTATVTQITGWLFGTAAYEGGYVEFNTMSYFIGLGWILLFTYILVKRLGKRGFLFPAIYPAIYLAAWAFCYSFSGQPTPDYLHSQLGTSTPYIGVSLTILSWLLTISLLR